MYIPRICKCGLPTVLRTSWTATNPGRRFHCCSKPEQDSCGFNGFYDPPMCPRSVQIIPGLLRNINQVQEVATNNEKELQRSRIFYYSVGWCLECISC
ncbi:hypothetical protein CTI12_AA378680 [Artemisia annua]|uniref:GRF-type domain-containing protein n=1 Tax=Artemisia annua TaxID=35608 RepID=A0A2U1MII4_ARTAN|nr:hypothetical protein CTI12_AA378680 [Artemisia annua]